MNELLLQVAERLKDGSVFCGSKWRKVEAEVIAHQTILACARNLRTHGEPLSWLGVNATRGRAVCGTDNSEGLRRLLEDGSLAREAYAGTLSPPADVVRDDAGRPIVLRCTLSLLKYTAALTGESDNQSRVNVTS